MAALQIPEKVLAWSGAPNMDRKRKHDFQNAMGNLVFAVELQEPALVYYYAGQLIQMYAEALAFSMPPSFKQFPCQKA